MEEEECPSFPYAETNIAEYGEMSVRRRREEKISNNRKKWKALLGRGPLEDAA